MPTYEVTIANETGRDVSLTFQVEASGWVEAWHEAMRAVGEEPPQADARCVIGADGAFVVRAPTSGRVFTVKPLAGATMSGAASEATATLARSRIRRPDAAGPPERREPRGEAAAPSRPPRGETTAPDRGGLSAGPRPAPPEAGPARPPLPRAPTGFAAEARSDGATNQRRRDASDRLSSTADPAARRLRTEERALLAAASARRAADAATSGQRSPGTPRRRQAEPTLLGHGPAEGRDARGHAGPSRGSIPQGEHTADFHAMVSNHTPLPQQFPAMAPPSPAVSAVDAIQEAVATARRHVPCELVQALRRRDDGALEVVAASGERDREVLSRRVAPADAFPTLRGRRPTRVKFAEQRARLRYTGGASEGELEFAVRSTLCVPIVAAERPWGVLLLVNAPRSAGFVEGELRAVRYLVETLERALAAG